MTGQNIKSFLINLPNDTWKKDRFDKSMKDNQQSFEYKIWNGVIVRENPQLLNWAIENNYTKIPSKPLLKGNIGAALAHITLWEHISKQSSNTNYLIFEDNALFTKQSLQGIQQLKDLNYDFVNLSVLRPKGKKTHIKNLLKLEKSNLNKLEKNLQNVWLSSYLISQKGATEILNGLKKSQFDISVDIIDRCLSKMFCWDILNIEGYIYNNLDYFGHIETKNDTRKKENM